jgi:hypothetical protein
MSILSYFPSSDAYTAAHEFSFLSGPLGTQLLVFFPSSGTYTAAHPVYLLSGSLGIQLLGFSIV